MKTQSAEGISFKQDRQARVSQSFTPTILLAVPEDLTDSEKTSPVRFRELNEVGYRAPDGRVLDIPSSLASEIIDWNDARRFTILTWGEKVVLGFTQTIRAFSQQWITHVLLVLVLFIYTALGGVMFHYVEGPHEVQEKRTLDDDRAKLGHKLRLTCKEDEAVWSQVFSEHIRRYEHEIALVPSSINPERKWNYFGALFFSGTVYTTIAAMADENGVCRWPTQLVRDIRSVCRAMCDECGFAGMDSVRSMAYRWTCAFVTVVALCFVGGIFFRIAEGWHEVRVKCGVQRTRHELVNELWETASYLDADVWRTLARDRLKEFESAVHNAREVGVTTQSTKRVWSFSGALYYVVTVVTTIGYGNVVPSTDYGRALTMAYAFLGIPLVLMVLTDLGKMFTRTIKFIWSFVRRFYYTGSLRRIRASSAVKAVSKLIPGKRDAEDEYDPKSFIVDENFDLPVSIALILLLVYILLGALMMKEWENDWTYFRAVYFIFVSLTTIGFGDMVPNNPTYLLITFVYLLFGLALTSMCINVVQVAITNTFTNAKNKLALRIGLSNSTDLSAMRPGFNELVPVHGEKGKFE